jgi:AraC-like DNA-binding protein
VSSKTLARQAEALLGPAGGLHADIVRPLPGLLLLRHVRPTRMDATMYEPVLCTILQGSKETAAGNAAVRIGAGESLIVSHDVPVVSRITSARTGSPYLAVILSIDVTLLRGLYDEVGGENVDQREPSAMSVHETDPRVADALSRYLALAHDPVAARVLGPSILREIHFRLLVAPHGVMLRRLLRHDSHESAIANAIAQLRREYRAPLAVPDLARRVGMSESSFYSHFKRITSTTPLQYHKQLRLLEARRLLAAGQPSIAEVAFEVGYESPSQFSRDYARRFGASPSTDARASATGASGP